MTSTAGGAVERRQAEAAGSRRRRDSATHGERRALTLRHPRADAIAGPVECSPTPASDVPGAGDRSRRAVPGIGRAILPSRYGLLVLDRPAETSRRRAAGAAQGPTPRISGGGHVRWSVLRPARSRAAAARSGDRSRDRRARLSRAADPFLLDGVAGGPRAARVDRASVRTAERRVLADSGRVDDEVVAAAISSSARVLGRVPLWLWVALVGPVLASRRSQPRPAVARNRRRRTRPHAR